jgi:4-amino-4-deoxy-L-arabinose transferase-like glycosyltransferase
MPQIINIFKKTEIQALSFLIFFALCWTFGADLSHTSLLYDMTENYTWGKEMQMGYYKHPPLFAWISFLWLSLFGTNHLAYFSLSMFNSCIGLYFIFLLTKLLLDEKKAIYSLMLSSLILCYNIKALRFNANTILLPLFPATTYFFLKSLQNNKTINWILFGTLSALSILGKYSSVCLILTFGIYTLHKQQSIFKNPKLYLSIAIFLIIISPHIIWLFKTDFLTLSYMGEKTQKKHFFGYYALLFPFSQIPYLILTIILTILTTQKTNQGSKNFEKQTILYYFTFIPLLIMTAIGFSMNMRIIESWGIPNWFMFCPLILQNRTISRPRLITFFTIITSISYLTFSIFIKTLNIPTNHTQINAKQLYNEIEHDWNLITNNRKIIYAVGNSNPIQDFIFYSKQHPHALFEFNYKISPWIPQNHNKNHSICICETNNIQCQQQSLEYFSQIETTIINKKNITIFIPK